MTIDETEYNKKCMDLRASGNITSSDLLRSQRSNNIILNKFEQQ